MSSDEQKTREYILNEIATKGEVLIDLNQSRVKWELLRLLSDMEAKGQLPATKIVADGFIRYVREA